MNAQHAISVPGEAEIISQLGEFFQGWFWGNVLVSVVGAVILIVVVKMLRGR